MDCLPDLWKFLKERKKWWLIPIVFVLLLIGVLIVVGGSSAVAIHLYFVLVEQVELSELSKFFIATVVDYANKA